MLSLSGKNEAAAGDEEYIIPVAVPVDSSRSAPPDSLRNNEVIDLGSARPIPVPVQQSPLLDDDEKGDGVANFFVQTAALSRKNALLLLTGKIRLFLILILPVLGSILAYSIDNLIQSEVMKAISDNSEQEQDDPFLKCKWKNVYGLPSDDCFTFMYAPSDNLVAEDQELAERVMEIMSEDNELSYLPMQDSIPTEYTHDVVGLSSQSLLADYMAQEEGKVSVTLLFDYEDFGNETFTAVDANLTAYIFKNDTYRYNKNNWWGDDPLRRALDRANLRARLNKPTTVSVNLIGEPGPDSYYDLDEFEQMIEDIFPSTLDSFLVISYAFCAILFMNFIAREKQQELIGSLRSMGMHDTAYWMSWNIIAIAISLISSILVVIFTYIADMKDLSKLNFFLPFFILWISQTVIYISSYFLVVLAPTQRVLNGLQFLMVVAFIMGAILPFVSYGRAVPPTFTFLRVVKTIVPSANFNLILGQAMSYKKYEVYTNLPDKYNWKMFDTHLDTCIVEEKEEEVEGNDEVKDCIWKQYLDNDCKYDLYDNLWSEQSIVDCWVSDNAEKDERCNIDHCYYSAEKHSVLLGTMVLQMIIFQFLTWYLFQIIPSGNGIAKRPWFLFQQSYWLQRNLSEERIRSDSQRMKSFESKGLIISNLRKLFKGGKGVSGMNLEIENGQIFCLLGHNGAGKTTLINLLTGKIPRDYGDAYFRGHTLSNELNAIQEMTSVVPQHDRLWAELSAYEHIRLFATLKKKGTEENITKLLKKVHLEASKFQASGEYSGGMKRRLSIAIATVGSAKILYMDEPTTGIDPLNRRRIWSLIQELKVGRIIVLTTHLMQEADVLGDTIGIMDNGLLKVKGTPLNLKTHYGSGYTLNIFTSQSSHIDRVCQLAQESINDVDIVDKAATSISLGVPKSQASAIPLFARQIQSEGLIQDWSVSQSTIEEVFLRLVTKQSGSQVNSVVAQTIDLTGTEGEALNLGEDTGEKKHAMDAEAITFEPTNKAQILALCRKLWILRKRSRVGSILQLTIPIAMALIMVIGQTLLKPPNYTMECDDCSSSYYRNYYQGGDYYWENQEDEVLSCPETCALRRSKEFWLDIFNFQNEDDSYSHYYSSSSNGYDWRSLWSRDIGTDLICHDENVGHYFYDFNRTGNVWITPEAFNLFSEESGANFIIKDESDINDMLTYIDSKVTYFESPLRDQTSLSAYNYPTQTCEYCWSPYDDDKTYVVNDIANPIISPPVCLQECQQYYWGEENCYNSTILDDVGKFEGVDVPLLGISTQVSGKDEAEIRFELNVTFGREPLRQLNCASEDGTCNEGSQLYSLFMDRDGYYYSIYSDMIKGSYELLGRVFNVSSTNAKEASMYDYRHSFNVDYKAHVNGGLVAIFVLLLGVSLSFSTISLIFDLVSEKQNGHVFALLLNGMKIRNYWISSYAYQASAFIISSFLYLVLCAIIRVKAMNNINWGTMIVLLILFMNGQFAFTCLLSNLFNKPRLASALLMLLVFVICITMFSLMVSGAISDLPLVLDIIPLICFSRSVYYLRTDYRLGSLVWGNLIMIASSLVYFGIGVYLHGSTDKMSFLKKTLSFLTRCFRKKTHGKDDYEESDPESSDALDIDVQTEENRARNLSPSDTAVKVDSLSKTFRMKGNQFKNAVVDLSLAMDRGEVFGLLGPNGCGKTTTISMITGQIPPSRGQVFVGGFNVVNERMKALEQLGIVPQFDVLYDDLTVCEHLEIYAQMKGVNSSQIKQWAQCIAELVSLSNLDLYLRKAKELSGGMKRRLSIGISLLSHPKVLFLDEPTTGLDPDVKRSIWDVIESMRHDRCILLTTHAMDEAEALCDRIGIMAKGSLLCIGSQNHLRSRYGDSFELSFTTRSISSNEVSSVLQSFLEQNFSNVVKTSSYGRSHVFTISRENVDLTTLFDVVISGQSDGFYEEWGIGQSSLDEIFCKITAESEADE